MDTLAVVFCQCPSIAALSLLDHKVSKVWTNKSEALHNYLCGAMKLVHAHNEADG